MYEFFSGAQLREFINNNDLLFVLQQKEAEILVEYLEVEKSYLFNEGFQLKMMAENYNCIVNLAIDEVIDLALDIIYELSHSIEIRIKKASNKKEYRVLQKQRSALFRDKAVLEGLFERTVYAGSAKEAFA